MARRRELAAIRAAKARKKRRRQKRIRKLILTFEIIILMVLLGTTFVMAKYGKFQKVDIDKDDIEVNEGIELEGYTTIALFGGDSREGQLEAGTHADTIIVVAIDNDTKEIRMASIYRDTLLQQMDNTYKKANHAYFIGGPTEAINMLNKNLDLDIEDYVTVDFKAMADVVDLMDGVEVEVTDAEAQMMNKYISETAKAAGKKANELPCGGTYVLDGPQAVTYARLRKLEGGDYKRTERQRTIIKLLFEKIKTTDLSTINKMIDTVFPQISTSISLKKMIGLAPGFMKYRLADNEGFPFEKTDGITYPGAGDVVVAQGLAENVKELHEFLYPTETFLEASENVKAIAGDIEYLTGVVRPAELDAEETGQDDGQPADSDQTSDTSETTDTTDVPEIEEDTSDRGATDTGIDGEFQ